jgi:hypothetical protein
LKKLILARSAWFCLRQALNNNDKLILGLIYKSPSDNSREYTDNLWDLINEASNAGYSHILLMGDFNLPDIDWDTWSCKGDVHRTEHKLLETSQNNFLFQHISKPTTWRGSDTPHILDLIITNEENMISDIEYQSPLGKNDHCMMKFDYNCYTMAKNKGRVTKLYNRAKNKGRVTKLYNRVKNKGRVTKLYNRAKFKEFSEELEKIDWENELSDKNDININWNSFLSTMRRLEDKYIPTKNREKDNKHKFPLDKETRELIKTKNSLSKKVVTSRDPDRSRHTETIQPNKK